MTDSTTDPDSIFIISIVTIHEVAVRQLGKTKEWIRQQTVKRAQKIAIENRGYDNLCWTLAEIDIALRQCYLQYHKNNTVNKNQISLSDIEIRPRAQLFYNLKPTIAELHWFIAERQILLECFVI